MAARENGQIPLRMYFNDLDAERIIGHALLQWSEWLHIDERSSPAERERAELMKDQFERQQDRSTMFYLRKMLFPWLWKWIERFHGTSMQAEAWRLSNPQSELPTQVRRA